MPASLSERGIRAELIDQADSRAFRPQERERLVVAILAAYPSVRAGLASLLQLDNAISATSLSLQALLAADGPGDALPLATDLILVDPGDVGREAIHAVMAVSQADDIPVLWLGYPAGGLPRAEQASVIAPDVEGGTLIAAIHAVAAGLTVTDPNVADQASGGASGTREHDTVSGPLSPREQEVLQLVAAGLPNKAIARELGISDHTVKFHVSSLLTKLDAGSRTEAVTVATRRGLLFL